MAVVSKLMHRMADSERAAGFVRDSSLTRPLVDRFVAGETLDQAVERTRELNDRGIVASLDLLGENVSDRDQATSYTDAYIEVLDRIEQDGVQSNISIKLTMLGLDISDDFCWQNLERIVAHADKYGNFVRIDMEGSRYTAQTLELFRRIHDQYPEAVGTVLQSYLYRTDQDVEEMIERGARIRIVKGAYNEPAHVAYQHKQDVDEAYFRHIVRLLEAGNHPAIATHDVNMIIAAKRFARQNSISRSRYEYQMVYGVRRDLQEKLAGYGETMRVYVPYGQEWYPYFTRRLAERPANVMFLARSIARD